MQRTLDSGYIVLYTVEGEESVSPMMGEKMIKNLALGIKRGIVDSNPRICPAKLIIEEEDNV